MAFDLFNEHGHHFRTGNRTWRKFITLAMMYGWQPAGTLRPEEWDNYERLKDEEWEGDYLTNNGQIVAAQDALAMAVALEEALEEIPDEDPSQDDKPERRADLSEVLLEEFVAQQVALVRGVRSPAAIEVTGIYKDKISELVDFCRQGSFRIY